jgi:aspartate aminotransferase-like enzyme
MSFISNIIGLFKSTKIKLFTIGPVQMFESTLKIRSTQLPYFRTTDFSNTIKNCDDLLKDLIGTNKNSKVMYLTSSGTGAMSATVSNFISNKDRVLIINSGSFGKRICEICDSLNIDFDQINVKFNQNLDLALLNNHLDNKYKAVFVVAHETSTGYLADLSQISLFCKKNNSLLIVDAITTFLCDQFQMDELGVDIAIISSHKGLCISPGIAMTVINEKSLNKINKNGHADFYFDFNKYVSNLNNYQTPYTPAIGIILELEDILLKIKKCSLNIWLKEVEKKANLFRNSLDARVSIPTHDLSNAITPIIFKKNTAKHMHAVLAKKYSFITNPSGGEYAETMLRISHIGNLSNLDYQNLNKAISRELNKL